MFMSTDLHDGQPVKYALTTSHNTHSGGLVHTIKRPVIGTVKRVFLDDCCQKPLDGREVDVILVRLLDDVEVHNEAIVNSRSVHLTGFADCDFDGQQVVKFRDDDDMETDVSTGVVSYLAIDVFDKHGRLDVGGPEVVWGVMSENDDSKPFHFPGESGTLLIRKPEPDDDRNCADGSQAGIGVAILYARLEFDAIERKERGQVTRRRRFISVAKPIQPIIERITGDLEFADVTLFPDEGEMLSS